METEMPRPESVSLVDLSRRRDAEESGDFLAYRERLHHPDEAVRQAACLELTVIGQPFSDELLLEALADSSPHIRQIVADGLVELASEDTIESLAEMLRLENAAARNEAMEVLARLGDRSLLAMTIRLLDPDGDVRIFAANVLGNIGDPAAFEPLQAALGDPNENVRYAAVEALGKIGDRRAVEPLLEVLRTDEWARFPAIEAIGQLGDPQAVEPLMALLDDPWLRFPIVEALGWLGDEATGRTLLNHVNDAVLIENPMVGHVVLAALGRIDERHGTQFLATLDQPEVVALLSSALTVVDEAVRRSVVTALGWVGNGETLSLLLPHLDDDSEEVQKAALQAVVRLGNRDLPIPHER